ncbi:MAG: MFS transporter [Gemmataceae bacterium]|nr:MFS transporter [Gemmataceae bacterium]MDW8265461.1 MFS transporter [Gemmataceae bacterium]
MRSTSVEPAAAPLPGARLALVALLVINLFNYIDRYILAAVIPQVEPVLFPHGHPQAKFLLGLLSSAFLVTYMVTSPLFGWLGDRMARWKLIGFGVLFWSLASGASGLAGWWHPPGFAGDWRLDVGMLGLWVLPGAYVLMFLTRCLVGVGEAAYGPVAPTMIADFYPVKVRGSKLAWFYLAFPVGSALGYALGGMSVTWLSWRWAFFLVVPPGLALGIWCYLLREPPRGQVEAGPVAPQRTLRLADYTILLQTPSYVLNCLAMTAMSFSLGGMAAWMPAYVQQRPEHALGATRLFGIEPVTAFGLVTVVAGFLATLAGGVAGDWLRPRVAGSYFLVSGTAMLAAFPFVLLTLATPFPLAWVWIFLAEFGLFFNTGPTNTALANVTHPAMRATAFALNIFFIHALGDVISPPIIGHIADRTNLDDGFRLVSVAILLGGLLWLWGTRYLAYDTERAPSRLGP